LIVAKDQWMRGPKTKIDQSKGDAILVGHSSGASFLLKYQRILRRSENRSRQDQDHFVFSAKEDRMGYYTRVFCRADASPAFSEIQAYMKTLNPSYKLEGEVDGSNVYWTSFEFFYKAEKRPIPPREPSSLSAINYYRIWMKMDIPPMIVLCIFLLKDMRV